MDAILSGLTRFRSEVFPQQQALYRRLVSDGQQPKALVISCADSRVAPELITQSGPGELFVCRNAGNIVPPFAQANGGVSSVIEYAVMALGVRDILVCGHSDCGAMKALLKPEALTDMPNVRAWLRHSNAAHSVLCSAYPRGLCDHEAARILAQENVVTQLQHLRTHPSVAARLAKGDLSLHGWFFDLETGEVSAVDGTTGRFARVTGDNILPIAVPPAQRLAAAAPAQHAAE